MWSKCTGVGRISINITSCRRLPSRNSSSFGSSRYSSHRQCCRSRNRVPRTRCATRCLCFVSIKLTTHLSKRNGMGITRKVRNKCSVSTKRGNKHKDTKGTKTQRKAANKNHLMRPFFVSLCPLCLCVYCPLATDVTRLCPDPHIAAGDFHSQAVIAGSTLHVITEVVLMSEFRADLVENRLDRFLLSDV